MRASPTPAFLSLDRYLSFNASRFPGKRFIIHGGTGISYSELDARCDALAGFMRGSGIRQGDRVAIFLENSVEYAISLLGIMRAGAIAVPLSEQHTSRSALTILKDFEPSAVILSQKVIETLISVFEEIPSIRIIIHAKGEAKPLSREITLPKGRRIVRMSEIVRGCFMCEKFPGVASSDHAMIIYTSGTTGSPKGVVLTHANLVANAISIIQYLGLTETDSVMVVLPFFYSYGNSLLTTHLISGGTLVLENSFLYPNVVLEKMAEQDVTGFAGVPSTFSILLQRTNLRKIRFPRLRYVTQAGGAMSTRHVHELREALPDVNIFIMYGQTEATARLTYLDPHDLSRKHGSIGKSIPGVSITLKKEGGAEAGLNEIGEIVAQGDNIMAGYWNNPSETEKVLRPDGLHTGDLAKRDDEGYLYIVGRRSDMIKSGAHRISPKEIEEVVLEHPWVGEVTVVGVPDDTLGEAVYACVVLKDEANPDGKEILLHCRRYLPIFKIPKRVIFFETLPKTSSGKVKRLELMEYVRREKS